MDNDEGTGERVFHEIKQIWFECFNWQEPILPTMRMDHCPVIWDDLDLLDLTFRLETTFGIRLERKEWLRFWGTDVADRETWEREVGHQLTFGRLTEFIRNRIPPISVEPFIVLGRPCQSAAAFLMIEKIIESLTPGHSRFGPSTPLRAALTRSEESMLWTRLRWITPDRLPDRTWGMLHWIAAALLIVGMITCITFSFGMLTTATILTLTGLIASVRLRPGLPNGITTFRDLAKCVSKSRTHQLASDPDGRS